MRDYEVVSWDGLDVGRHLAGAFAFWESGPKSQLEV